MTRGKWVALAVGVAVSAVLVPYGPALWRAVAYVEERLENVDPGVAHSELSISTMGPAPPGFLVLGDEDYSRDVPNYVVLKRKRFSWLPGPESLLLCGWCVEESHGRCPWGAAYVARQLDGVSLARCACPHSSHAQESE